MCQKTTQSGKYASLVSTNGSYEVRSSLGAETSVQKVSRIHATLILRKEIHEIYLRWIYLLQVGCSQRQSTILLHNSVLVPSGFVS